MNIPEFNTPADDEPEELAPSELLSASLMGTVVEAYNDPSEPGVYLRYQDGSVMNLFADATRVTVRLVASPPRPH